MQLIFLAEKRVILFRVSTDVHIWLYAYIYIILLMKIFLSSFLNSEGNNEMQIVNFFKSQTLMFCLLAN